MTAATSLAELVATRREELGLSLRQAAEKSGGLVGPSTLNSIERGDSRQVTDRVIAGIATGLDLPESRVRRAAGLSAQVLPPFEVPARANRLNARERRLVLQLIDTLLAARGEK
jgi:transcriptional regulator with XRE-family HTH domain